jgi:hypothetical protein
MDLSYSSESSLFASGGAVRLRFVSRRVMQQSDKHKPDDLWVMCAINRLIQEKRGPLGRKE